MGLILRAQNGEVRNLVEEYTLDTPNDLTALATTRCASGSTALIISTGEVYMKNSMGLWEPIGSTSSSGKGEPGKSAYEIAVQNGFEGTEAEWLDSLNGEDGKTAYEIAVDNGFEGSESEWLESLNGEDGVSGVYIGTEEPTEDNVEIWINTEAELPIIPALDSQYQAAVGDVLVVTAVDENGRPVAWTTTKMITVQDVLDALPLWEGGNY